MQDKEEKSSFFLQSLWTLSSSPRLPLYTCMDPQRHPAEEDLGSWISGSASSSLSSEANIFVNDYIHRQKPFSIQIRKRFMFKEDLSAFILTRQNKNS